MKKEKILAVVAFIMLFCSNMAFAAYPIHFNGDNNYVLVYGKQGVATYLDKSSVAVCKENENIYMITVSTITSWETELNSGIWLNKGNRDWAFIYKKNDVAMYNRVEKGEEPWSYIPPLGSEAVSGKRMCVGELAYAIAFNKKYYGAHSFYNEKFDKYEDAFSDSFYDRLRE